MYRRKLLYDTNDFYRGRKKQAIDDLCIPINMDIAVILDAHSGPPVVTPLKPGEENDVTPTQPNYAVRTRLQFGSSPSDQSIETSDMSYNSQSIDVENLTDDMDLDGTVRAGTKPNVIPVSQPGDQTFIVDVDLKADTEYLITYTLSYAPKKKPECVQTLTRTMHIKKTKFCALDQIIHIGIEEVHYSSTTWVPDTRAGGAATPIKDYTILDDPNISGNLPAIDVSYGIDGLPNYTFNGLPISVEEIADLAGASISGGGGGRSLGGTVSPVSTGSIVTYDAILKVTDPILRYGPIWKDTERNMSEFQVYEIPKIQGIVKITKVLTTLTWYGITDFTLLPADIPVAESSTHFFAITPPWPTQVVSQSTKLTIFMEEVGDPDCKRVVDFVHYVDANKTPILDLAIMGYDDLDPTLPIWGDSYQTKYTATQPVHTDTLQFVTRPLPQIPRQIEFGEPTSLLNENGKQVKSLGILVNIAMKVAGVNFDTNDWIFSHTAELPSKYGQSTFPDMIVLSPAVSVQSYLEGAWVKCAKSNKLNILPNNALTKPPFLQLLCENFSEANPRESTYAHFNNPPPIGGNNKDYSFQSVDTQTSVGSLAEYYKDHLKYFPVSTLKPWEPVADKTVPNRGTRTRASNVTLRYIRPQSTVKFGDLTCNFLAISIPPGLWGPQWTGLSSRQNGARVSLTYKIVPKLVATTRNGVKIADTDEDGTSTTKTASNITTLDFNVVLTNEQDYTVEIPFGYVADGLPTAYTVNKITTGYRLVTQTPSDGVYKGAVDIRHFEGKAGYRHFFEIQKTATSQRIPFSNKLPLVPLIAINSLDPPGGIPVDDSTGTYVYCPDRTHKVYYSWLGARNEPKQQFLMPVWNDENITSTPYLAIQEEPYIPFKDQANITGTITYTNGYSYSTVIHDNTYWKSATPISFASWKANVPQGFSWATLTATNQARRTALNTEFIQYTGFNCDLPQGSKVNYFTMAQIFTRSQKLRAVTNPTNFVITDTANEPAGTFRCPNDDIGYFSVPNNGKHKIESITIYFQGVIKLATVLDQTAGEIYLHGTDINIASMACVQVPPQCLLVDGANTWTIQVRKPNGGAGKAHGIAVFQLGA